jgi:Peptidase A4 family
MSASDLAAWGYPPQPDPNAAPQAYAVWANAVAAAQTRIFPWLVRSIRAHGPTLGSQSIVLSNSTPVVASAANSALGSYNWSGYLNTNANGAVFTSVSAQYVVPRAQQAPGACTGGWDYSSTWVGLDGAGAGANDVLQAGTYADAFCGPSNAPDDDDDDDVSSSSQTTATRYSAWYEWYPINATNISGLTVKPGDNMFVEVWSTSPTTGGVFVVDLNTQQYVSVNLTAPAGVQVAGGSAEWITERPSIAGSLTTLTNYISEYVSGAYAVDSSGTTYAPAASTPVVMVDQNMQPISYPSLLGTDAMQIQNTGSSVTSPQ